jgi:hypothetical protein
MTRHNISTAESGLQRQAALARWDNDGGASPDGPQGATDSPSINGRSTGELAQLRARVIALENIVIAILSSASKPELELARDMAAYITPRPGAVAHPLTTSAAAQMLCLVERAVHFRAAPPAIDLAKGN